MPKLSAFEKCTFCPKLCRHACPVATVSGRESATPTAMMSAYWAQKKGILTKEQASAGIDFCTSCGACTLACKDDQPVATLLFEAAKNLRPVANPPDLPKIYGTGEFIIMSPDGRDWSKTLQRKIEKTVGIAFFQSWLQVDLTTISRKQLTQMFQPWANGRTMISTTKQTTHLAKLADLHVVHLHDLVETNVNFLSCGSFSPVESHKITCCGATISHKKTALANQMAVKFGSQFQEIYIDDSHCAKHLKTNGINVIDPIDFFTAR